MHLLDEKTRETLFVEIHRQIWKSADEAVSTIRDPRMGIGSLVYPPKPDGFLTDEEVRILRQLAPSDIAAAALKRLIADACATAFFHVFALMDAVGSPGLAKVDAWVSIDLTVSTPDTPQANSLMLHDEL